MDSSLNSVGATAPGALQQQGGADSATPIAQRSSDVTVYKVDGSLTHGPVSVVHVTLQPMEVQVLGSPAGTNQEGQELRRLRGFWAQRLRHFRQSAIRDPQSAICNLQSAICNSPIARRLQLEQLA